jgi:hypothetical protein
MSAVDLYWLPLGAGGRFVRRNGRVYEAVVAWLERRPRRALYHAALLVDVDGTRGAIEMGPAFAAGSAAARGAIVAAGPVGARCAGRWRVFRYVVRRGGEIPDVEFAVDSPRALSADAACARHVLDLVGSVPTPVWGRDELHAGEMWNSNSLIAWLLERAGLDAGAIAPPAGGRAPGWAAGVAVARR